MISQVSSEMRDRDISRFVSAKQCGGRVLRKVQGGVHVSAVLHPSRTRSSILSPSSKKTCTSQHVMCLLEQEQILFYKISKENRKIKTAWSDLVHLDLIAFGA